MRDVSLPSVFAQPDPPALTMLAFWTGIPTAGHEGEALRLMGNPHAARSVWEGLSPAERKCLWVVVEKSHPEQGMPKERILQQTKLAPEIGDAILDRLVGEYGLLHATEGVSPRR